MREVIEPSRAVGVTGQSDVVVCGGGPAGVAAALAAAKLGAQVQLMELHGCLGGVWTSGLLSYVLDTHDKPKLLELLHAELNPASAQRNDFGFIYDPESMKLLLERWCLDAGVRIRLHTHVVAASRDAGNQLQAVLTESKSGREAWSAKVFIDATGDGDLAFQAGCGFDWGHPTTGLTQPMSLMALLTGIDAEEVGPFLHTEPHSKHRLLQEFIRAGVMPSYSAPTIFPMDRGLFALMANHEYGVSAVDADQITRATLGARAEVATLVGALRKLGGEWENLRLVSTAAQIGVREGRRIHGLYRVTEEDLASGVRHADAVCRVNFGIDVHSTQPHQSRSFARENKRATLPYDIPARALIAKDVGGLILAGRCISGDFFAHSSYRVTGNAVALGEAAGTIAAYAISHHLTPEQAVQQMYGSKLLPGGV